MIPFAIALAIPLMLLLVFPWASQFVKRRGCLALEAIALNVCETGITTFLFSVFPFHRQSIQLCCRALHKKPCIQSVVSIERVASESVLFYVLQERHHAGAAAEPD